MSQRDEQNDDLGFARSQTSARMLIDDAVASNGGGRGGRRTRSLFVSYSRTDRDLVHQLKAGLQRLHHNVWVDDQLSVGQDWWNEILEQIRDCDAVIAAVSPDFLESQASATERAYARRLGKVTLPVRVRPVRAELLPPDLAHLQIVDYCDPSPDAAFQLADALAQLPVSPPLPNPLPEPPAVPVSYLSDLTARVHAPNLPLDEQLALVARLRAALMKDNEREPALELLLSLHRRHDIYFAAAREIETITSDRSAERPPLGAPATSSSQSEAAFVPPDWYPDPTQRHRLRWFDGDWTEWVSNGRTVTENPL
jgi:hypothetical protein